MAGAAHQPLFHRAETVYKELAFIKEAGYAT
jgi:hypothetical protein